MSKSKQIRNKLEEAGIRYWAGDNISEVLQKGDKEELIDEAALAFESVLDTLVIDRKTDPNSMDTGRRLAKMYYNELMAGRYETAPPATAPPPMRPPMRPRMRPPTVHPSPRARRAVRHLSRRWSWAPSPPWPSCCRRAAQQVQGQVLFRP